MKCYFVSHSIKSESGVMGYGHCFFITENEHFILKEFMDELKKVTEYISVSIISFQEVSKETYEANQ